MNEWTQCCEGEEKRNERKKEKKSFLGQSNYIISAKIDYARLYFTEYY